MHSCRVEVCGGKYEEMECFCDEITIMTVPPPGGLSLQPGRARVDHAAGQVNGRRKAGRRRGRAKSVGVISDRPPPGRSGSSCGGRRQQASPTPTWTPAPDFSIGKHRDADRLTAVWPSAVCSSRPFALWPSGPLALSPSGPLALWPSRLFADDCWSVFSLTSHTISFGIAAVASRCIHRTAGTPREGDPVPSN